MAVSPPEITVYEVELQCTEEDGEIVKKRVPPYKWDSRDMAQMYGIGRIGKVLVTESPVNYYVTNFIIISK